MTVKKYAIAATRVSDGKTVYWHNDGRPTTWQEAIDEWKFDGYAARSIMTNLKSCLNHPDDDCRLTEVKDLRLEPTE